MPEVGDVRMCAPGQAHQWEYMGREALAYHCLRCGGTVGKPRLKAETDPLPATMQPYIDSAVAKTIAQLKALNPTLVVP